MTTTHYIIIAAAFILFIVLIIIASKLVKKAKRNALFNEENDIHDKNNELYENLVSELERTKKISKNDESINLYNSWIEEFERINLKKESIDNLFQELENFYNDKDHKNFVITYSELEGKKYKFDEELKTLYKKVKQYTEYELDNTRISLQLKTEIKELTNVFQQKLELLEIFNKSFYEEITVAQNLIADFEQLQRDGDYPEGRNVLKKCNRAKNKIKYTLEVILEFYDYILDLEEDLHVMTSIAKQISTVGFTINIRDFDKKVENYSAKKEKIFKQVIAITFNNELEKQFVKELEEQLNELDSDISELKDIVEEKYNFIQEIMTLMAENAELIEIANEVVEAASIEKQQILALYSIDDSKQIKRMDEDIEIYQTFKNDYNKVLEIAHEAGEDYASIKTRIKQSNTYLLRLIQNMKIGLSELKAVRDDEIKAIDNLTLYNNTLIQIDLFLRKYQHRNKLSSTTSSLIEDATHKLNLLQTELNKEPLNINIVRKLDDGIYKILNQLVTLKLGQDIRRKIGAERLINYCSIYNESDELNLTIKRMYTEYQKNEYFKILKDATELLKALTPDSQEIYENITTTVEDIKFEDVFSKTVEQYKLLGEK